MPSIARIEVEEDRTSEEYREYVSKSFSRGDCVDVIDYVIHTYWALHTYLPIIHTRFQCGSVPQHQTLTTKSMFCRLERGYQHNAQTPQASLEGRRRSLRLDYK